MIDYEEEWLAALVFRVNGSLIPRAAFLAIPSCCITLGILFYEDHHSDLGESFLTTSDLGIEGIGGSQLWNAVTVVLTLLLGFRSRQGLMRFWQGTGLLHQMRGEWFDTVSNCVTFSISAKKTKPIEVDLFRHSLVRLMSRCHGSALEEIAENCFVLDAIDTNGLDSDTLQHLKVCHEEHKFNKVEVMLHLVQSLITKAHDDSILRIPPPILSRVYQTISRGFVNLLNAKKITDTRFPFPYAQLISFLLIIHVFLTPLIMSSIISNKFLAALMTFVPVCGMATLNFIAIELENPFGTDANDLPMQHFQDEMNACLLMLLHPNTDMITTTSPDCVLDFHTLLGTMSFMEGHLARQESPGSDKGGSHDLSALPMKNEDSLCLVRTESIADHGPSSTDPTPPEPAPCPAGCGFQVTWHSSHCCHRCHQGMAKLHGHGEHCDQKRVTPAQEEAILAKDIDKFEAGFKQWTKSVEAQVTLLNESFTALRKFNENTSKIISETNWPIPPSLPHAECSSWQTAVSPI